MYDLEKNVQFIYLARAPWYFGALFLFFALFHATPHTLAKWGGQSGNSKFWLNLLYTYVLAALHVRLSAHSSICLLIG